MNRTNCRFSAVLDCSLPVVLTMAAEEENKAVRSVLDTHPNIGFTLTAALFGSIFLSPQWRMVLYSVGNFR